MRRSSLQGVLAVALPSILAVAMLDCSSTPQQAVTDGGREHRSTLAPQFSPARPALCQGIPGVASRAAVRAVPPSPGRAVPRSPGRAEARPRVVFHRPKSVTERTTTAMAWSTTGSSTRGARSVGSVTRRAPAPVFRWVV